MNAVILADSERYGGKAFPQVPKYFRKVQSTNQFALRMYYEYVFRKYAKRNHIELCSKTQIREGLYIGHPYGITINPRAVIGKNVNIHKGVTIGQENRGECKGKCRVG